MIDLVCRPVKPSEKRLKMTIELQEDEVKRKLQEHLAELARIAEEKRLEEEQAKAVEDAIKEMKE